MNTDPCVVFPYCFQTTRDFPLCFFRLQACRQAQTWLFLILHHSSWKEKWTEWDSPSLDAFKQRLNYIFT